MSGVPLAEVAAHRSSLGAIDLLFVCTANKCRSPMAEVMARALFAERGIEARVRSTGITADGSPAAGRAIELLARRGLDLSNHRSATLTVEDLRAADVVVAMSRRHAREVVMIDRSTLDRTFTLRELVRRGTDEQAPPCRPPLRAWAAALSSERRPEAFLGASSADDIADPFGQGSAAYEELIEQLDELLATLADLLVPELLET